METFVLVHGAMHGGWCWSDVAQNLRTAGHSVHTPTLTGQGERRHSISTETGVSTHVQDLVEHLWFEDLDNVNLVLHSYAGVLSGPVADAASDRLSSIIYLGAFLTGSGQCLLDVEPTDVAARYRELADKDGDGWRVPASDAFLEQWGITDPDAQARVGARLTDFPLLCQTEPTLFDESKLARIRQIYVQHSAPPMNSLAESILRAQKLGHELREIATGHDMMVAAPSDTAGLLMDIASSAPHG